MQSCLSACSNNKKTYSHLNQSILTIWEYRIKEPVLVDSITCRCWAMNECDVRPSCFKRQDGTEQQCIFSPQNVFSVIILTLVSFQNMPFFSANNIMRRHAHSPFTPYCFAYIKNEWWLRLATSRFVFSGRKSLESHYVIFGGNATTRFLKTRRSGTRPCSACKSLRSEPKSSLSSSIL